MPLTQTRSPFVTVQLPPMGGVAGRGEPFGTFGSQTPAPSHHAAPPQSASVAQVGEHAPAMQYGPLCVPPMQSALVVHLPHPPPPGAQYGAFAWVQGCRLATPRSEVHPAHVLEAVSQNGVEATQAEPFVAVHCTQWFVTGLHAGVAPAQLPSA